LSEEVIRALRPDFTALAKVTAMRSVIVSSESNDPRFDFVSRFFAPGFGVDEDPVRGSAHCCLGPYWAKRLGKAVMTAFQASRRGGVVSVRVMANRVPSWQPVRSPQKVVEQSRHGIISE